jgi:hypothetical protein
MPAKTNNTELAVVVGAAAAIIDREKALFLNRNADRCSHLLVRLEPGERPEILVIRAAFTLDEAREWHQAEARVQLRDLETEAGPDRALIAAFGQLDDGISAARIARLFAPLSVAQRLAVDAAE